MILDAIRAGYAQQDLLLQTGLPTGSRFGTCTAQLQLLRWPEISHPTDPPIRTRLIWEEGHLIEDWWARTIERVFPGLSGLDQQVFFFPVPLQPAEQDHLYWLIRARRLWGQILPEFQPTQLGSEKQTAVGRELTVQTDSRLTDPKKAGFILDPAHAMLYAPTFPDRIIDHPTIGPCVLESKALSNRGFQRALLGQIDYGKRCQLVGLAEATGLNVCMLPYRKETAHLAELLFLRGQQATRIEVILLNGLREIYYVGDDSQVINEYGDPAQFPGEAQWEQAITWTPFDRDVIADIQARILKVLLVSQQGPWLREYGPNFQCAKCEGVGGKPCGHCKGTGHGTKKLCGHCQGTGVLGCKSCDGGIVEETELGFPCSYCPVIGACYPFATLTLDTKPHYRVTRKAWQEAQLTFSPPRE